MVISKRERYIGIGVVAAIGLLIVDRYALTPYAERSQALHKEREALTLKQKSADVTFAARRKLQSDWTAISKYMKHDSSEAEGQARTALRECAEASGVSLGEVNADRPITGQDGFRIINLRVNVTGRMATISRMLWHLETMPIPLRIASVDITSRPENSDELRMEMTITTLAAPLETRGSTMAMGGGR